jgi:hypothetical protein
MIETINKISFTPAKGTGCFAGHFTYKGKTMTYYFEVNWDEFLKVRKLVVENNLFSAEYSTEFGLVYSEDCTHGENDLLTGMPFDEVEKVPHISTMPDWEEDACFLEVCDQGWGIEIDYPFGLEYSNFTLLGFWVGSIEDDSPKLK